VTARSAWGVGFLLGELTVLALLEVLPRVVAAAFGRRVRVL